VTQAPEAFRTITDGTRRRSRDRERAALAVLAWWLMRLWQLSLVEYARRQRLGYRSHGTRGGIPILDIALLAHQLERYLTAGIEDGASGLYSDVLGLWLEAAQAAQAAPGGPEVASDASVVALERLVALGGFQALDDGWRDRLRQYTRAAVADVDRVLRAGLVAGLSVSAMNRALKNYVVLSARFQDAFEAAASVDAAAAVRTAYEALPGDATEAGRMLGWQTRRITVSEIYDARFVAETRAMTAVPAVNGLRWTLSPSHNGSVPDLCDVLAKTDWYGMGPGVFPVGLEPKSLAHPHCRCELVPVFGARHPNPPTRTHSFDAVSPHMDLLTENAAGTMIDTLDRFFR
jgi:hypothetical protein